MGSINILKRIIDYRSQETLNLVTLKSKKLTIVNDLEVEDYLQSKLNYIYLRGYSINEVLKNFSTRGCCFYISIGIIHAMENYDLLVNGNLSPECVNDYKHQWVEFYFNGSWYVIDSTLNNIYYRDEYYSVFNPKIYFKKSKKDLMSDNFIYIHDQLLKNPDWTYDADLFLYYMGKHMNKIKNNLYKDVQIDDTGSVKSYSIKKHYSY